MSIRGVVTTRHVLRHAGFIVREFGPVAFLRCCFAIVSRRRTTFLSCVTRAAPRRSAHHFWRGGQDEPFATGRARIVHTREAT